MSDCRSFANNNVSVDCVVLGFDGLDLNVLLVRQSGEDEGISFDTMKLPGGLIYTDENLDEAAHRVLTDLTGIKRVSMNQFRAYGSAHRTDNPKDVRWLEHSINMKISRIVTVAYLAAIRIDRRITSSIAGREAVWVKVQDVPALAFDHNIILSDAMKSLKTMIYYDDSILFSLLPPKFTIMQYRLLLEAIGGKKLDNSNIYKKIATMPHIVPLEEKEQGLTHRAARYFKYDKSLQKRHKL